MKLGSGIETTDISEDSLSQTIDGPRENCNAKVVTKISESFT